MLHYIYLKVQFFGALCLLSRRLGVVGERENGRTRGRHARGDGLLARPFFLVLTTSKRLLRRLPIKSTLT